MNEISTITVPAAARAADPPRLYRLGVWTARNPLKVVAVWLILLTCALFSARYFASHLTGGNNVVIGSDSQLATQLIEKEFPGLPKETDFAVLHSTGLTTQDAAFHRVVSAAVERYQRNPDVAGTANPYDAPQRLISPDRRTALVPIRLGGSDRQRRDAAKPLQDLAKGLATDQVEVYFTGSSPLAAAEADQGAVDLAKAERIGFPAAAIVLLLAFGSLVAAAIPLGLGFVAVLTAFGALGVASVFTPFNVFAQTAVSMVGIALGIDYTLFIVTRFREELSRLPGNTRADRATAVGRTMETAGRAVLFSGTTVVVSLAGLWLVRSSQVHSIALGMTAAVAGMMVLSVSLLPALLGLLGTKINRGALPWSRRSLAHPDPEDSGWARLASMVMRRPVLIATLGTLLLGALAIPAFGLRYGVDLGATAVADSPAGKGYTVLTDAFAPGTLAPIRVSVESRSGALTDEQLAAISQLTTGLAANGDLVADVSSVTGILDQQVHGHTASDLKLATRNAGGALDTIVSKDGSTTVITVSPRYPADSAQAAELVRDLRGDVDGLLAPTGLTAHVGGSPAQIVDITDESSRAMPIVIAAVLAASWVMLLFAFRSLLLPFKAIFMNLLTCGAAFGATVLIFQEGHGARLLGAERTGFIQVVLPLFAFALVFGLSMDYEVFMLSRMREEWLRTGDNPAAVRLGITRTARVITAAAAIMVVVFASFVLTRGLEIKQLGFMLALAVLIDATIVRLLLVPAYMRLMGSWNWWLPRSLDRLIPRASSKH
jgi:RND superfamily putative drug exporter